MRLTWGEKFKNRSKRGRDGETTAPQLWAIEGALGGL